jgi:ribonuclease R
VSGRRDRRQASGERGGGGGAAVVVQLTRRGRGWSGEPFLSPGGRIVVERDKRLREGALALLRTTGSRGGHAKLLHIIGRPDVARDVLEALMLERGLRRRFDPYVDRQAREAAERGGKDVPARRDLRSLTTFTVDPASAKDFDDAISAEATGDDAWRVWVHIADVSAFVEAGSPVDREAYRRSTSVYVPGKVEPMLPPALSNEACSLVPHADRMAVTVEMEIRGQKVVRSSFHRSLVRSDERLDYDRVDRIFAGQERAAEPWAAPLAAARAASAALGSARASRALALNSTEPDFRFDAKGHVTHVEAVAQTESHRLIEHLMVAANEQVAALLEDRKLPALYRVHERPEPDAVLRLADQLASLDVPLPALPARIAPDETTQVAADLSRAVADWTEQRGEGRRALTYLVLRSLKQASYSPRNVGHAGLGSARYCHFTSPIRRYPDLVCHRALLSAIGAGEEPPERSRLDEVGAWTSAREREAMVIERDADDVARAFLLERTLFEGGAEREFEGEVTSLISAGAFVSFGDGFEGLLPVRRLRGEWWELNEQGTILRGSESGRAIRLGDRVRVTVGRIEAARGRVDLYPTELAGR